MATVLVAVVAASLVLTYGTLTRGSEVAARERIAGALRELVETVNQSLEMRGERMVALTRHPEIDAVLGSARPSPALANAYAERLTSSERALPAVLLDRRDSIVLSVGAELTPSREQALRAALEAGVDSVRFGRMFADREHVYFWTLAPVRRGRARIGTLALLRGVGGPRDATESLRGLIGEDVSIYMRNDDGSVWTTGTGAVAPAATRRDTVPEGYTQTRAGTGPVIGSDAAVNGAPWLASLETPLAAVHGRARRTTVELSAISLILAAIGAVAAWVISRHITKPLGELSRAASAIARGGPAGPVRVERDDEIGHLAATFNSMAAEIEASKRELERKVAEADHANRTKSDFLAVMSHELRTPLNAIGGYTQLLDLEVYGPLNDAQRDAVARLERSQAHLLRLINNVLSFSRIDSGQLAYEIDSVGVDATLSELEDLVAPQIRARGITFTHRSCGPGVVVSADREKLQQVVLNLLTNSIKFTPPGGQITVSCAESDGIVQIFVRDTGCGIEPDVLPAIFDPFVQANRALHRPNEGVGLGLAIARDLARGMGGDLSVESEVGKGSTFTLSLRVESDQRSYYTHPIASTSAADPV
jgi:signal transduction histidine kinase